MASLHRGRVSRRIWFVLLGSVALVMLFFEQSRTGLIALWFGTNLLIVGMAAGWGVFNPRRVWSANAAALRWAFWLTAVLAFLLYTLIDTLRARFAVPTPILANPALGGMTSLVPLFSTFLAFPFFTLVGLGAAAVVGTFAQLRGLTDELERLEAAVTVWWVLALTMIGVAVAVGALGQGLVVGMLLGGLPILLLATVLLRRHARSGVWGERMDALRRRLSHAMRILVRRRRRGGVIDLRGPALGLAAGIATLVLASFGALRPLQSEAFVATLRVCGVLGLMKVSGEDRGAPSAKTLDEKRADELRAIRERVVLLHFDGAARRDAMTIGSEASVQAALVRQLCRWGVARIVLPMPYLRLPAQQSMQMSGLDGLDDFQTALVPKREDVARTKRDLPGLLTALRDAKGRVIVSAPQRVWRNGSPETQAIRSVPGVASALSDIAVWSSVRLPIIPIARKRRAPGPDADPLPAPILLAGGEPALETLRERAPQIEPGVILVDYRLGVSGADAAAMAGSFGAAALRRVGYSDALHGERVPVGRSGETIWTPPADFFKNKIVFLDSIQTNLHETPLGASTEPEILARATQTLLTQSGVRRPAWIVTALLTLGLSVLVGGMAAGRAPLDALWRVAIPFFALNIVSLFSMMQGTWLDPVVPLVAAVAAFLGVTQFTFASERAQRDRNRSVLQRFLAPHVVEEVLDDPEAKLGLGGARRRIVILFADVRGFTQFAERHTPEEVIASVNAYMTVMTDTLNAYDGILDKYTGDGLMAFFDIADDSQVERAVRAAVAMATAATELGRRFAAEGRQPLAVGIGLHYGEAVVGMVGHPVRQVNYTAMGSTVVVGARLQSIASGGEVIISEAVQSIVGDALPSLPGELVQVKGIREPVRPYRVLTS